MNSAEENAREAYLAGTLLAHGIQKLKLLPTSQQEQLHLHVRDSLRKMGVSPDLVDLKQFKTLTAAEGINVVIDIKSSLGTAIRKSCGEFTSGLFLLTFDLTLVSTNPANVSEIESVLLQGAVELGFGEAAFKKILARLSTEPDDAVAEYETSVEVLISKRADGSNGGCPDGGPDADVQPGGSIRDVIALLAAVGGLAVVLGLVWKMTESTVAFVAISITAVLLFVLVLAYVAANTRILRGMELVRVILAVLEKVPVLAALVGRRKKKPPTNSR